MSNIEPTEEQKQAANQWLEATDHCPVNAATENALAHLLAEREAKLRDGLARIIEAVHVQMAATALPQPLIDVVRGVYAEHPYALHRIEDLEDVCHALQDERDTLRARVAELEERERFRDLAAEVDTGEPADSILIRALTAREAQHLADIKALRRQLDLSDDVVREADEDNNRYQRIVHENWDVLAATAHYDDAKADAPAVSPDCPRESPECITVGFHAVDECERRTSQAAIEADASAVRGAPFDEDLTRTEGGEG